MWKSKQKKAANAIQSGKIDFRAKNTGEDEKEPIS